MTREEAIARIKDHMIVHKMHESRAVYISEALDMAIQALSQEPTFDDVLDKIRAEIEGLMSHDDYMVDGFNVLDIIDKYTKEQTE